MSARSIMIAGLSLAAIITAARGQAPPPPPQLANPLAAQPLDGLAATRERPLFSPTRRPPPPPPPPVVRAPEPPPPPPPPNITLVGIVMDGEEARALVRTPSTIMHARIGDDIEGWKVVQIEGRKLVLSLGDRLAEVSMFIGDRSKDAAKSASRPPDAKGSAAPPRDASHAPTQRSESASQGSRSSGSRGRRRNRQ
jgi:general secretion pathway protein N